MYQVNLSGVRVLFKLDELVNSYFSFSSDSFFNIVTYYITTLYQVHLSIKKKR